jgi:hypothetical protein
MNQFGVGVLIAKPAVTSTVTVTTPRKFGDLQSVTVEESYDNKELYSSYSAARRVGRGKLKISIKAKTARINGRQYADIFNVGTISTGSKALQLNESATIPSATPYTVTVANASKFSADLGVETINGVPLTRVSASGSVATGQYYVDESTGTYTFATADTGLSVLISYEYTTTTGYTVTKNNQLMQESPYFAVHLMQQSQDGQRVKVYPRCSAVKLSEEFKMDDWTIPDLEITALDNGSGLYCAEYYPGASATE